MYNFIFVRSYEIVIKHYYYYIIKGLGMALSFVYVQLAHKIHTYIQMHTYLGVHTCGMLSMPIVMLISSHFAKMGCAPTRTRWVMCTNSVFVYKYTYVILTCAYWAVVSLETLTAGGSTIIWHVGLRSSPTVVTSSTITVRFL